MSNYFQQDYIVNLTDSQLQELITLANAELYTRNIANSDPDSLIKLGFEKGFTTKLTPVQPLIHNGILIAPGYKKESSVFSHKCSFIKVNDSWVWESDHKILDEIRSNNKLLQSITLIALMDGFQIDVLTSKARNSVHVLENIVSYNYEEGVLFKTSSRNISNKGQL
jgi:hypothetical protein